MEAARTSSDRAAAEVARPSSCGGRSSDAYIVVGVGPANIGYERPVLDKSEARRAGVSTEYNGRLFFGGLCESQSHSNKKQLRYNNIGTIFFQDLWRDEHISTATREEKRLQSTTLIVRGKKVLVY